MLQLGDTLTALDAQIRAAQGKPGATSAQEQAKLNLRFIASEVIGSIKAFDKVKTAPRQHRVIESAATKLIPVLVSSGVSIVSQQLDQLMTQFQEDHPAIYNAYLAARVIAATPASPQR